MNTDTRLRVSPKPRKRRKKGDKPDKPRPDFPLFAHATKRWAKKIRGKMHYFGPWDDADGALNKYLEQKDDLHAGRTPRVQREGLTVRELCNQFWNAKRLKMEAGQLSPHSFNDYDATGQRIVDAFGENRLVSDLAADDFMRYLSGLAKTWGPVAQANEINRVRVLFKWGYDSGLYDKLPRYGPDFKRPSKKVLRLARAQKGPRMFEAAELRKILKAAKQPLRAMILLGINAGLGNADVGRLPMAAIDLKAGWLTYHREKTGIPRRCPLWKETVAAVKDALAKRPVAADESLADRVFLTAKGGSWYKDTSDNPVSKEMAKLLKKVGINGHRNFYALRHTFETIGGDSRDQVTVDAIMGHAPDGNDMAAIYRERISDERLIAVVDHVRAWLFAAKVESKKDGAYRR